MRACLLLVALAASLCATPAEAQVRDSIPPGTRVRLWLFPPPEGSEGAVETLRLQGTLRTYSADSLTLALHPGVAPLTLSWPVVRRLDRSRGMPSRLESGLRWGLISAAVGMVEFVLLEHTDEERTFQSTDKALLWGGVTGASFGFILGVWHPQERWTRVHFLPQ
jgi:hypothetical protein